MIPVPMSVELGPYGPPNPSGTDQMTRLRRMPPVYAIFRKKPARSAKARASSKRPIVVVKNAGFALTAWLQKLNQGASQSG